MKADDPMGIRKSAERHGYPYGDQETSLDELTIAY